jgi:two-component system sensor histidine kinase/response regulator
LFLCILKYHPMLRSFVIVCLLISFSMILKANTWQETADSLEALLAIEQSDTEKVDLNLMLGNLLLQNQPEKALDYVVKAKKLAEKLLDNERIARSTLEECDFYSQIGEYTTALKLAYDALNIAGSNDRLLGMCHNRIATVHANLNNYKETLYHNKKSLYYSSATGDSSLIIVDVHNIGRAYTDLKLYDSALFYLRKTNRYEIRHKHRPDPYSLSNIGNVYIELGKLDSALYYHLLAYKYDTKDDQKYLMGIDEQFIANTYLKMKRYNEAEDFAKRSIKKANEMETYDLALDNYEILYKVYSEEGNFKKAFDYAILYNSTKDTLHEKSKQSLIFGLETKYNVKEQEARLLLLEKQKTIYFVWALAGVLFVLCLIVIVILVYRRQRMYRELTSELRLANESKERLLSIIGHDLRGSIGTLRTAAKAISEGMTNLNDTRSLLESFYPVADSTYDLLENLLTWANYNKEKIAPNFIEIDLKEIADKSVEHTHHMALSKSIKVINNMTNELIRADKNMLLSVMRNILSNAIKFSHPRSRVLIDLQKKDGFFIVSVTDHGIGMEKETLNRIFNSPDQVQSSGTMGERGSGLGIMICRTFLQSHGGDIWAESEPGKGSTFYFSLPVNL